MNDNVVEAVLARRDMKENIDLLSDMINGLASVDRSINTVIASEDLSPLDKSDLLSGVVVKHSDILDMESIDVTRTSVEDMEGLKDKVLVGLDTVKSLFKSTRQKLFEAVDKSKNIWVTDNLKRIELLESELSNRVNVSNVTSGQLSTINKLMNNNLATIKASGVDIDSLPILAKSMTESFRLDYSSEIDEALSKLIKRKDTKIVGSDYIKVTRLDSNALSYIVVGNEYGVQGIRYYDSTKIKNNTPVLDYNNFNVEYAQRLLDVAREISKLLPNIAESIRKELATVEDSMKDVSSKSKWKTTMDGLSIGTLSLYVGGAILVGFGVSTGGLPLIASMVSNVGSKGMSFLSMLVNGYMKLNPRSKAVVGAAAISAGMTIPKTLGSWFKKFEKESERDDSYYQEIEEKAKVKLLNARVEMTTKYSLDAIYGMYFLTAELISTASIIIEYLDKKENM